MKPDTVIEDWGLSSPVPVRMIAVVEHMVNDRMFNENEPDFLCIFDLR